MDMAKDISLQRKLQILTNCLDLLSRARITLSKQNTVFLDAFEMHSINL